MNFVQQKSANLGINLPRRNVQERNVTTSESSGMLQKFFLESTTGILQLPPEPKKTKKGIRVLGSGHSSSDSHEPYVILVITEGRNNATGEIGMAAVDINSPTLILSQFSDDLWYTGTVIKIQMLEPAEIVVPNTVYTEDKLVRDSTLLKIILKAFPNIKIKPCLRKFFNDVDGMNTIDELCSPHCQTVKLALEGKYYTLSAAGGLFHYLKTVVCVMFAPESLQIVYEAKYGAMMIDVETSKRLELVASLMPRKDKNGSLYQCLDRCQTNIGKRSLRARILAPLCDVKLIHECQEAVQELVENQPLLDTLKAILKKFRSVDKMQRLCVIIPQSDVVRAAELMISHVINVKSCLESLPQLNDILSALKGNSFEKIREGLEDPRYASILEQIEKFISNDLQMESGQKQFMQRIHAVKEGSNVFLDVSRKLYHSLMDDLKKVVTTIGTKYELSLQLGHNTTKGYHMILIFDPKKGIPTIPEDFEVLMRRGTKILLRCEEIVNLDLRIRNIVNEILIISNQVIHELLQNIRKDIDCFYMLTGVIIEIDLIQNFATLGSIDGCVCPTFGSDLKVVDGIHPFLEFGHSHIVPVPNNIIATPDYNFFLITGPNMGGKTVYIKMIAILQIMAQIGLFVPASEASFRICDKLFSRMGFEDTIQRGVSNFHHEVQQSEYIQKNITPNSLVIVDELGRSTNPQEGKIWAWAMCEELSDLKGMSNDGVYFDKNSESSSNDNEKLINITSPFIFLTTHFKELTKLPDYHFNMINLYLEAEEITSERGITLNYTHKVKFGVTPLKAYGLALARHVKFSQRVIPRAEALFKSLEHVSQSAEIEKVDNIPQQLRTKRKEHSANEKRLYDLYASLAAILRPGADKKSDDFLKKEVDRIMKKFINDSDPQFLIDLKNKPPSRSHSVNTTTNIGDKSNDSRNMTINDDLRTCRTLSSVASEFRAILNKPVEQLRQTYTITPRETPNTIEEVVQRSESRKLPLINFNLKTPCRPKPKANIWEIVSSKKSSNALTAKPSSISNHASVGEVTVDHSRVDLFERDKRSSADFCIDEPGPSRKRVARPIEIPDEEDDINNEYDRMLNTQITSTQDNTFPREPSEEYSGMYLSPDKVKTPEVMLYTPSDNKHTGKTFSEELEDFLGDPVENFLEDPAENFLEDPVKNSTDPWMSSFPNDTKVTSSRFPFKEKTNLSDDKHSKENTINDKSIQSSLPINKAETSTTSSGDFSKISSIAPVKKPQVNLIEKYREKLINRMKQGGPMNPIRPNAKAPRKPLITRLPQPSIQQLWEQRRNDMDFLSVAGPSNTKHSTTESEKSRETERTEEFSNETQMSVCSAKVPWFPEIGTLSDTQMPKKKQPLKEAPKKERMVLDLAQLRKSQNSNKL